MIFIIDSVGKNGKNFDTDVIHIQNVLNLIPRSKGGAEHELKEDGKNGPKTIQAITRFQKRYADLQSDGRIHAKDKTIARLSSAFAGVPKFTDMNLYGPGGPSPTDIQQSKLQNCYFVGTLAAVAQQYPSLIRRAITYYPQFKEFQVLLYDWEGKPYTICVNQNDLHINVGMGGGSLVDDTGLYQRVWPAVMETAYAKTFDNLITGRLVHGFNRIDGANFAAEGMGVITGTPGDRVQYNYIPKLGETMSIFMLGSKVQTALKKKKVVTLAVKPEFDPRDIYEKNFNLPYPQDGLLDRHLYSVVKIERAPTDCKLTVRDPYGVNINPDEGTHDYSDTMTISLKKLVKCGGLNGFQVSDVRSDIGIL